MTAKSLVLPEDVKYWNQKIHFNAVRSFFYKFRTEEEFITNTDGFSSSQYKAWYYLGDAISLLICQEYSWAKVVSAFTADTAKTAIEYKNFEKHYGIRDTTDPSIIDRSFMTEQHYAIEKHSGLFECYKSLCLADWISSGYATIEYMNNALANQYELYKLSHKKHFPEREATNLLFSCVLAERYDEAIHLYLNNVKKQVSFPIQSKQSLKSLANALYILSKYYSGEIDDRGIVEYTVELWSYYAQYWSGDDPGIPYTDSLGKVFWANQRALLITGEKDIFKIIDSIKGF